VKVVYSVDPFILSLSYYTFLEREMFMKGELSLERKHWLITL